MYHKCVAGARIDELHLHMSLLDLVNLDLAHPPGNVTFDGEGNDGDSRPVELVLHGDVEQLVVAQGLRRVAAGRRGGEGLLLLLLLLLLWRAEQCLDP